MTYFFDYVGGALIGLKGFGPFPPYFIDLSLPVGIFFSPKAGLPNVFGFFPVGNLLPFVGMIAS